VTTLPCETVFSLRCSLLSEHPAHSPPPGSPLNRLSFLRSDPKFLSAALLHPSTQFLLLRDLAPLAKSARALEWATHADVAPLIGGESPFTHTEETAGKDYDSRQAVPPQLVFLGVDEKQKPSRPFSWKIYTGRPYFALDVTPRGAHAAAAETLIAAKTADGQAHFLEGRTHMSLAAREAAIYAAARSVMDWNGRNPFCAGCGHRTISVNAGFKRMCPGSDKALAAAGGDRPPCATRGRISNLSFPRTDPTIIVAVLSADGLRLLLGRQRSWPPKRYSTLAGFVEPGESVEEAVRREVWEESGIALGRVQVYSTQPWPYPASLMIGCVAQALPSGEEISLEYDPELEDARWVPIDEVRDGLVKGVRGLDFIQSSGNEGDRDLILPPPTAIANQLMEAVVNGGFAGNVGKL
jgi:NAD+ diphosphatase